MTIAMMWVRELIGGVQELLIASDSRTSCGRRFDACPKVFPLSRGDAALCFAGETDFAYPMMLQVENAINAYRPSRDRARNISHLRGHAKKLLDSMQQAVHFAVDGEDEPDVEIGLAGYNWAEKRFRMWIFTFSSEERRFVYDTPRWLYGRQIAFLGDQEWKTEAKRRLKAILQERHGLEMPGHELDMEPFQVLVEMLRASAPGDSIGGPPQLVKVYQHMNCKPVGIFWPHRDAGTVAILGRMLLDYENTDTWVLDPDTMRTEDGSLLRTVASAEGETGLPQESLDPEEQ
jgi:hypothetical protein